MQLADITILFFAGLTAGVVNAIAGGGTFFAFAALLMVGVPPIAANATSSASLVLGSLASTLAYRAEIAQHFKRFILLGLLSLLGGVTGAVILLQINNDAFSTLVPFLLLGATILFAISPFIAKAVKGIHQSSAKSVRAAALFLQFLTAVYGGFFGAGMGIVMLASLVLTEGNDFHIINAAKNMLAVLIKIVAIALFIAAGIIYWSQAVVLTLASITGGYVGVMIGRRIPIRFIRLFVTVVGMALSLHYFVRPD